jgi:glucose-6-phosphate isomerase
MFTQNINFKNYLFKKKKSTVKKNLNQILNEKNQVIHSLSKSYKDSFSKKNIKHFNKKFDYQIIGMGGSTLGAQAIYNFLKKKIKKKLYFFDDLDTEKILEFKKNNQFKKVLFLIISKSGNTIETLSNLFSLKIIKKKTKNIILIAEKNNNPLVELSKKFNLFYIEHKNYIGGRYSVFSEAGIVPALLMGLNITKFRSNITMFLKNKEKLFLKDSSIKLACLLDSNKINTLVFLNYEPELNKFLYWCQQLIAESLGKKGKGFLPIISNMPKDNHSVMQLYLDGVKNNFFTFFFCNEKKTEKLIKNKLLETHKYLSLHSTESIIYNQKIATENVFNKKNIPFRSFELNLRNEKTLGELFCYFILETILLARCLNVNAFDQPSVELIKTETKKLFNQR